jgi:hypothetical protein
MSNQEGKHWFLFSYQAGNNQCNMRAGFPGPLITKPRMDHVKKSIPFECDGEWVLMNISLLGYMTEDEFSSTG